MMLILAIGSRRAVTHEPLLIDTGIVKSGVEQQVAILGEGERGARLKDLFCGRRERGFINLRLVVLKNEPSSTTR